MHIAIPESTFSASLPGSSARVFLLSHIITPAAIFDVLDAFYLFILQQQTFAFDCDIALAMHAEPFLKR